MKLKDLLLSQSSSRHEMVEQIVAQMRNKHLPPWDLLVFSNVLPYSGAMKLMEHTTLRHLVEKTDQCDYIDVNGSQEQFDRKLSKNMRKNLRLWNNRASRMGSLSLDSYADLPDLEQAFGTFLALESSGWKGENGTRTAIGCDPNLTDFYSRIVRKFGACGAGKIDLLRLNKRPIAATFGLQVDDVLYALKIAYDESMAKVSPGNLQIERLLRASVGDPKLRALNLVSGNASKWHVRWPISSEDTYRIYIFNRTFKGNLIYFWMQIRKQLNENRKPNIPKASNNTNA